MPSAGTTGAVRKQPRDAGTGATSMVATAAAVTSAILGTITAVPGHGDGHGSGDAVYMASTQTNHTGSSTETNVLHGISAAEDLPVVVPPQPYEPEAPRPVAGPQQLQFPDLDPAADLPDPLLTTPGSHAIPPRVLAAYEAAARQMQREKPSCHMSWPLLAGIGRIESGHADNGDVDSKGTLLHPIIGPALNGEGHFALIFDTDHGKFDGDTVYDRAVGPMQFLPETWAGLGRDGNGDGKADPNNVADAALATAGYLCLGGGDMLNRDDLLAAVFTYNRSWEYVSNVLAWAGVYVQSVAPVPPKGKHHKRPTTGPTVPTAPTLPVTPPVTPPVIEPTPTPTATPTPTPTPPADPTPTPSPDPATPTPSPSPQPPVGDPTGPATITGRVFLDGDALGLGAPVDNPADPGVAGATVRVTGTTIADGTPVDLSVPTDANGVYALPGLLPGTYSVTVSALPAGLTVLGVLAPVGWLPGFLSLGGLQVGPGAVLTLDFLAGPVS